MSEHTKKAECIIAEFDDVAALLDAAGKVRQAGYKEFDCHSPFPIHGMDEAMGLKRSPLGWMVGIMSFIGAGLALYFQWWTGSVDYPYVISGKPFFSYQAYVPIIFGIAVLFGAMTAVFGMLTLNKLPRLHHSLFYSDKFAKFSTDGFFVSIGKEDPLFDPEKTSGFLQSIGGKNIEIIKPE